MDLKSKIREIQDFPVKGIGFKDITTLLSDPKAFKYAVDKMGEELNGVEYDVILGPEARGFIFGAALGYTQEKPFVPIRKKGKLPYETVTVNYDKEYGQDTVCIHKDAIKKGDRVVIVDDLLATGGTISAVKELIEKAGGTLVKAVFLIELDFLNPRSKFKDFEVSSLIHYEE